MGLYLLVNSLAVKVPLALGQVGQGDIAKHVLDGLLNQLPDLLLGAGIRKYTVVGMDKAVQWRGILFQGAHHHAEVNIRRLHG